MQHEAGACWVTHLGTDDEAAKHATPDDEGLQHIEAVERGYEGVLHFLVVLNGLVKVAPLQILIAEVLDSLIVQQGVCGFGALCIVKAVQVPAATHSLQTVMDSVSGTAGEIGRSWVSKAVCPVQTKKAHLAGFRLCFAAHMRQLPLQRTKGSMLGSTHRAVLCCSSQQLEHTWVCEDDMPRYLRTFHQHVYH